LSFSVGLEIVSKQLELLKETVPKIRRVAILSNPANPGQPLSIREVNVAARSLGVQLQLLEARGPNEFDGAFAAMATGRVGAPTQRTSRQWRRSLPACACLYAASANSWSRSPGAHTFLIAIASPVRVLRMEPSG
jgi:hypothetical protein